jgi:hypothetical protein
MTTCSNLIAPLLPGRVGPFGLLLLLLAAPVAAVEFSVDWVDQGCIESFPVQARVSWNAESAEVAAVEVRIGSADGTLFTSGSAVGTRDTGSWVQESTDFFLVSVGDNNVLARTRLSTPTCRAVRRAETLRLLDRPIEELEELVAFRLSPPRLVYCGQPVERTVVRLTWNVEALGADIVQVFLGSEDDTLFAQGNSVGEAETRNWVRDGTTFVLYLPQFERVVARREFRILPCAMANP